MALQSDHDFPVSIFPVTAFDFGVPVVLSSTTPTMDTSTVDATPEYNTKISFFSSPDEGRLIASVSEATIFPPFVFNVVTIFPFVNVLGKLLIWIEISYPVASSFRFAERILVIIGRSTFSHT